MIIILTYKGTRVGRSMNDIKEEKLMDFIKTEMELGRTVHIVPEPIVVRLSNYIIESTACIC